MENHTLVLKTTKTAIPADVTIDFVKNLILQDTMLVDYFGVEIDNDVYFMDHEMKLIRDNTSYFNFYFDTEQAIDYKLYSKKEVATLILRLLDKATTIELRTDNKDVTIYF